MIKKLYMTLSSYSSPVLAFWESAISNETTLSFFNFNIRWCIHRRLNRFVSLSFFMGWNIFDIQPAGLLALSRRQFFIQMFYFRCIECPLMDDIDEEITDEEMEILVNMDYDEDFVTDGNIVETNEEIWEFLNLFLVCLLLLLLISYSYPIH